MLILRRGVDSNRALLLGSVMQEGGVVSEAAHAVWLRQQNRIPVQTQCRCNVVLTNASRTNPSAPEFGSRQRNPFRQQPESQDGRFLRIINRLQKVWRCSSLTFLVLATGECDSGSQPC